MLLRRNKNGATLLADLVNCIMYLIGEIFRMRGSESDPHVGIDA